MCKLSTELYLLYQLVTGYNAAFVGGLEFMLNLLNQPYLAEL
jgi:hypothetical protein